MTYVHSLPCTNTELLVGVVSPRKILRAADPGNTRRADSGEVGVAVSLFAGLARQWALLWVVVLWYEHHIFPLSLCYGSFPGFG